MRKRVLKLTNSSNTAAAAQRDTPALLKQPQQHCPPLRGHTRSTPDMRCSTHYSVPLSGLFWQTKRACEKSQALENNGGQGRNRTADTVIFSHLLYQLSYLATSAICIASRRALKRCRPLESSPMQRFSTLSVARNLPAPKRRCRRRTSPSLLPGTCALSVQSASNGIH